MRGEILFLEKGRYFFLNFFLLVTDFVFILLELVLGILRLIGFSRAYFRSDMFAFFDRERIARGSRWLLVCRIGLVMLCCREVDIEIGKVEVKFDDVFLTEGMWEKVVVEFVVMYLDF